MQDYRVIDLQSEIIDPVPRIVQATSPEAAAELALGVRLVRSGARRELRARVYWQQSGGVTNMVRLYASAGT